MERCFSSLSALVKDGQPCALVTVAGVAGSAPREAGARMIVAPDQLLGTIGGGNLEFEAARIARARLAAPAAGPRRFVELFPLGPMLEQCCGGAVYLHFELFTAAAGEAPATWLRLAWKAEQDNAPAVLASRVVPQAAPDAAAGTDSGVAPGVVPAPPANGPDPGKAVATAAGLAAPSGDAELDRLAQARAPALLAGAEGEGDALLHPLKESSSVLPDLADALFFEIIRPCDFQVVLFGAGHVGQALTQVLTNAVPCRILWIDPRPGQFPAAVPDNVETRTAQDPVAQVGALPPGACCLVMTHSHELDQNLCEALLRRGDFAWLGLIGSATKHRRFMQRLKEKGLTQAQLARLTCPIGIPGIQSKQPGAIAVSVAAQLLQLREARQTAAAAPS